MVQEAAKSEKQIHNFAGKIPKFRMDGLIDGSEKICTHSYAGDRRVCCRRDGAALHKRIECDGECTVARCA